MGGLSSVLKLMPAAFGKIADEKAVFTLERRLATAETIVAAMTAEERKDPDILAPSPVAKKEVKEAAFEQQKDLAKRANVSKAEIASFMDEFRNMRTLLRKQLKMINPETMQPVETDSQLFKKKKAKTSRGGGGGFGK
eukprot:gene6068-6682_t